MSHLKFVLEYSCVLLLAVCCLAGSAAPGQSDHAPLITEYTDSPALDESAKPKAETLSYIVQSGEVLIFNLPELLGGKKIEEYEIKRAPALSWLVKRSFFWRTLATDVGEHEVLLNAMVNGSSVESVVVQVEIR